MGSVDQEGSSRLLMGEQVVVLAGGLGTRLHPWTSIIPKPALPMLDRTLIEQVISVLPPKKIDEVLVLAGHLPEVLESALLESTSDVSFRIIIEDQPLGTGGALRNSIDELRDRFICLNGDIVCSLNAQDLLARHTSLKADVSIALWEVDQPERYGIAVVDPKGRIRNFVEKPAPGTSPSNLANAGVYVIEKSALNHLSEGASSLERDLFPVVASNRKLAGLPFEGWWVDAGTPASYLSAMQHCLAEGRWHEGRTLSDTWSADISERPSSRALGCALGLNVALGDGAKVWDSYVLDGVRFGVRAQVRRCLIGSHAIIGANSLLEDVIVDHNARVPQGWRQYGGSFPPEA